MSASTNYYEPAVNKYSESINNHGLSSNKPDFDSQFESEYRRLINSDYGEADYLLSSDFNHITHFHDEVFSISHEYPDRRRRIFEIEWKGQDQFLLMYSGNYGGTSYSKTVGESVLGSIFGFWYGNDRKMVMHEMENLPYDSKYSRSPAQRKNVLDFATENYWCYCEELSFECKREVAEVLNLLGEGEAEEIAEYTVFDKTIESYGKSQVLNALNVMEREKAVSRRRSGNQVVWSDIKLEEYIPKLEQTIEKYAMRENDLVLIENPTLKEAIEVRI